MSKLSFENAENAFQYYYNKISLEPLINGTKSIYDIGFILRKPHDNKITTPERKWKLSYAEAEWDWYLSGDPKVTNIGKLAKRWLEIADSNGNVNSNYGWQWQRNNQLDNVVNLLKSDKNTRRASISIFDGKELSLNELDVPCTYAINFRIVDKKLYMSVTMRSNDLWFGFCNDQYCFSNLQMLVADRLNISLGEYFHFTNNLHLYERHLNKNI